MGKDNKLLILLINYSNNDAGVTGNFHYNFISWNKLLDTRYYKIDPYLAKIAEIV